MHDISRGGALYESYNTTTRPYSHNWWCKCNLIDRFGYKIWNFLLLCHLFLSCSTLFQNHIDFTNQGDINFIYINKKVYLLGYMNIFFMKNVKVEAIGNATKLFTKRSYNAKKAIVQLNRYKWLEMVENHFDFVTSTGILSTGAYFQ